MSSWQEDAAAELSDAVRGFRAAILAAAPRGWGKQQAARRVTYTVQGVRAWAMLEDLETGAGGWSAADRARAERDFALVGGFLVDGFGRYVPQGAVLDVPARVPLPAPPDEPPAAVRAWASNSVRIARLARGLDVPPGVIGWPPEPPPVSIQPPPITDLMSGCGR